MSFLKNNIAWMAPTTALGLVAAAVFYSGPQMGLFSFNSGPSTEQQEALNAQQRAINNLTAVVDAAVAPQAPAAPDPAVVQHLAELSRQLEELKTQQAESVAQMQEVTRNEPADLLTVAPQPQPQPLPVPVAAAPQPKLDADFFNNAQSRMAMDDTCGDDLRALAQQTRVYFPSGGVAGSAVGMNGARLIGELAAKCPGFTLQVEGHSDSTGRPATNLRLSKERAETVVNRLAAFGISTDAFQIVGFGEARPSSVQGPESRAYYDRRVEFSVVPTNQVASISSGITTWQSALPGCAAALDEQAAQLRQFFSPGAITVPNGAMQPIVNLAAGVARCAGVRLRVVGHFTDNPGTREDPSTGRMRALVMMNALVSNGAPSEQVLVAAPSYSAQVDGNPGLPRSRIEFQVVAD